MFPLTSDEKCLLLRLARQSLQAAVCGGTMNPLQDISTALAKPAGAFVTLHEQDALRGCVGFIAALKPLYQTVIEAAAASALHDTRFRPVTPDELATLKIEIYVLSDFCEASLNRIQVGVHGVMVSRGNARGLLLPQVAVERKWTALRFLEETCRKAGLPPGAWKQGAKIELFTAEVFSERSLETPELPH